MPLRFAAEDARTRRRAQVLRELGGPLAHGRGALAAGGLHGVTGVRYWVMSLLLWAALAPACAGKRGAPVTAKPAPQPALDTAPDRAARTREVSTDGESERLEGRFGNEAAHTRRLEREAARKAAASSKRQVQAPAAAPAPAQVPSAAPPSAPPP